MDWLIERLRRETSIDLKEDRMASSASKRRQSGQSASFLLTRRRRSTCRSSRRPFGPAPPRPHAHPSTSFEELVRDLVERTGRPLP